MKVNQGTGKKEGKKSEKAIVKAPASRIQTHLRELNIQIHVPEVQRNN